LRGLVRCLDAGRPPAAAADAAVRSRTGARFRASRQMNSEMPPSTTNAPIAITIAELPVNALPPPAVALVEIVGVAVVVWVETDGCGNPCEKGLTVVDWATARVGHASAAETTAARTTRMDLTGASSTL
jgi:hypothetical protein